MKLIKILTIALTTTLIIGRISTANAQTISIIPEPYQMTKGTGTYTLPKSIAINAPSSANAISDIMAGKLRTTTGRVVYFTKNKPSIDLQIINDANLGTEGYTLDINEKGIQLKANANAGLFFGWQTVMQLLPAAVYANSLQANANWSLPYVSIIDKPRFGWRGMMLDVSRHFFSKEDVKTFIDDMARYKYNRFHWHLTDDQGWRIEIKSLPKLTSVGAWRAERKGKWMNITTPAIDEPKTYGGFYTQEDIKEVVAYAKARFIEVIPEVDVPGHSLAMNTAYPFLSTTPNYPFQVNAGDEFMDWEGLNGHVAAKIDNSLDPSNETVYEYLDKIFGEMAPLFPFEYIHMGADENPKNNWEKSPNVQALMKKEGLKDMNEVQSYFVRRVQKIINSKGKKMMGWDEILEGGLSGDAAVMSWRGIKGGIEAAKKGHKVVMKHVMIDTNVALDVLANRKPFAEEAAQLFNLAAQGRVKLYLSSLSYTTLFYVLKKDNRPEVVLSSLRNLEHLCETVDVNSEVIKAALRIRSGDLEDAVQLQAAIHHKKVTAIVTRDVKGFRRSSIPALNYREAIAMVVAG